MSEEFSSYPPVVDEKDWNALLEHGLEKPIKYIIRFTSQIEAVNGSTGKKDFTGTTAIGDAITEISDQGGGLILIKEGNYNNMPFLVKNNVILIISKGVTLANDYSPQTGSVVYDLENAKIYFDQAYSLNTYGFKWKVAATRPIIEAPDVANVQLFKSGENVTGRKDIIWERNNEKAFRLYNNSDNYELVNVDEEGNLSNRGYIAGISYTHSLFIETSGLSLGTPGTIYVSMSTLDKYRPWIDFSLLKAKKARLIISAVGDKTGSGKGIRILADSTVIAEHTWDGNAVKESVKGSWNPIDLALTDSQLDIQAKGSEDTETLTLYALYLQFSSKGV